MIRAMADAARHVEGLDAYALLEAEQLRALDFFAGLDEAGWERSTACPGWRRREMVAHLAFGEEYNRATLDATREQFIAHGVAAGAHDLDSFNDWGVRIRADRDTAAVLDEFRTNSAATRRDLRARGDRDIDSMAGPYPPRLQGFHLAFESAIHNDDMDVPVEDAGRAARDAWRAATARFMLEEESRQVTLEVVDGGTRVVAAGSAEEAVLPDEDLVRACSGRLRERADRYPRAVVEAIAGSG
jgi:uncharacterized protein (TIGR03083 family)